MTNDEREVMEVLRDAVRDAAGGAGGGWQADAAGALSGRSGLEGVLSLAGILRGGAGAVADGGGGGGNALADVVNRVNPLVGALLSLFGGGGAAPVLMLPKAERPAPQEYEAGFAGAAGGVVEIDRDGRGLARPVVNGGGPGIVVNIQALDSRSFLERTPEIAEAVRRAVLESEGLGGLLGGWQE